MPVDPNTGWSMTPFGAASPSTMAPLQPHQVAQIQATTSAMQQPTNPQQQQMMGGLFGPQSNLGPNLGAMAQGIVGGPAYGGGNMFSGDAYGGSAKYPLPGLTAQDYG